ncbi:hypothetical protein PYW07_004717 [Mythimna separata]|uniref:Cyclic nucleotide-binding domain-containing protein n=1 Tax=Mythimna separata TaxID=271217 RepID=A0AAD7YXL5_MYTSE|nr:hypothetical protein PYW07_004717 [Mythimna separata]
MLSICEVFLEKASLRSYTSITECEIMYIRVKDFFEIYKKFPIEFSFVQTCVEEFRDMFNEIFKKNIFNHRDYLSKLKEMTDEYNRWKVPHRSKVIGDIEAHRSLPVEGILWGDPESRFMQSWMLFRVVIVCVSITTTSILGGVGAASRWILTMIAGFCDVVAFVDIVVKCFLPYYNRRGIYITDKKKCLKNYLTKGFALDIIGAAPWVAILRALLSREICDDTGFFINTMCKFAHLYILFAYFRYITDIPTVNLCYVMIVKWQIVNILMVLGVSHYLMINCVHFEFNEWKDLSSIGLKNNCWMPKLFQLPKTLSGDQLHLIFAQSLSLVQYGMTRMSVGKFAIDRTSLGVGISLFSLGVLFWFITCYTLTLLVLKGRGDTVFQHSVYQLEKFLKSERVDKEVIEKVLEHFRYGWMRTKGVNVEQLTNARIGVMFRQDLSYYFYKKTLSTLDSIIGGGDTMQRHLAGVCNVAYFLPGYDIFREMDIVSDVYIVHRGRVNVYKDGKQIIILTKGDIFGQLEGVKLRPIRVTATADTHVDLLFIKVTAFQSTITDEMKATIARSRQAKNDFMATRNIFNENPYDTVQYLLRGCKTVRLPWIQAPMEARKNTWYTRWLYLAWLIGPFASSCLVLIFVFLPSDSTLWLRLYSGIFVTDAIDIANFVAEFYTIELVVLNNKCTHRRLGMKKFKDWFLYVDALSILIPLITIFTGDWRFQTARLLRLKFFIDFEYHFCRDFRSQKAPYILKIAIILLLVHLFTCGWILFACQGEKYPFNMEDTSHLNMSIDFSQWVQPKYRFGGCARTTRAVVDKEGVVNSFVVPRFWGHDYVVALTFILLVHTHTSLDVVIAGSLKQIYYQVFITYFMYLLDMWIMAVAINLAMNKYRVFYQNEYKVQSMMNYWIDNGISKSLIEMVKSYTDHVWKRQKGDWLPELAYRGPLCLRQDLFTALYIHHLEAAPTFRQLPDYFKRQLCARFDRIVIFPGKCIVREGDIFTTTYFIHEGEVEKWCTDASGEGQLVSILYTNGYFGCVSGLFPNASFRYSYYTRTVVDLMYLSLPAWEDLLESYPEVKTKLYDVTTQLIKDAQLGQVKEPRSMFDSSQQLGPFLGA